METDNFMRKIHVFLPLILIFFHLNSFVTNGKSKANSKEDNSRVSVIVIDAGHGGKDPGAVVGNAKEKDIVLDIALKLGNQIKLNFPETKVVYTRDRDIFVPLHQRAIIANKNNADVFISIHANYVETKSVQGTETFVLGQHRSKDNLEVAKKENSVILLEDDYTTTYEGFDPNSPESYIMFELVQDEYLDQSVMFASVIQDQFRINANRKDRSVKQAGFLVLRRTTMPSVLVEAGFLSHSGERNFLQSESGRTKIANSIFSAFKDYKKKIEEKSSFNLITENPPLVSTGQVVAINNNENSNSTPEPVNNIYFSVQIAASQNSMDTSPENFQGEKQVFKISADNLNKYYIGKFNSYADVLNEKTRLQSKYRGCFIVAFENNKLISVKKARNKM